MCLEIIYVYRRYGQGDTFEQYPQNNQCITQATDLAKRMSDKGVKWDSVKRFV